MDEFPAKHQPEVWESLQKIVLKCPNTRLFLTVRFHIRDGVRKHFPSTARISPVNSRMHDMGLYLKIGLKRDSGNDAVDGELEADILRIIPEVGRRDVCVLSMY